MPVGNLLEHVGTEPFPEFDAPLLMAGGTEIESVLKEIEGRREKKGLGAKNGSEVLMRLAEEVSSKLELPPAELRGGSRRRLVVEGKNLISYVAIHGYGITLTHVARGLNVSIQSIIHGVNNGAEGFRKRGWRLQDFIKQL